MSNRTAGRVLAMTAITGVATAAALLPSCAASAQSTVHRFDHVVVVVMENKNYGAIIGRPDEAPYINHLASGGAVFSNSFAVAHPSQPNYLALFSGSKQGVTDDHCPYNFTKVANLGAELVGASLSFTGFAESMPSDGYKGCGSFLSLGYVRAHNPWVDFRNVPAASNLTFAKFPTDFTRLPTVSFVIPNLCHDMHSCSRDTGDTWIQNNLGGYARWAQRHNSLLILTWDEDGAILGLGGDGNKVPTIFFGAHVRAGTYSEHISHYRVLRTIEDMYGLAHAGASAKAKPITDIWK
jgi:phosphatidylinositol-3-phosphatase